MLLRRVAQKSNRTPLVVGTSATLATGGTRTERHEAIAQSATRLLGIHIPAANVIDETLEYIKRYLACNDASREIDLQQALEATMANRATKVPANSWEEKR